MSDKLHRVVYSVHACVRACARVGN